MLTLGLINIIMSRRKSDYIILEDVEYKLCKKCKQHKTISNYRRHKRKIDGLQSYCIQCDKKNNDYNNDHCKEK